TDIEDLLVKGKDGLEPLREKLADIDQQIAQQLGKVSCNSPLSEWDDITAPSTGTLNAHTVQPQGANNPCLLPPSAGYQRLENQLYRVEVHQGGTRNKATFKWSSDNGSILTSIISINNKKVTVHDLGRDEILGFANGQWVEIIDDESELSGRPGQLLQID